MEERRFLTVRQTAQFCNVPESLVRRMVKAGSAPGFYVGNRYYIDAFQFVETLANLSAQCGAVNVGG